MRNARVKAVNLKVGDVISGKRIGHAPFVHKTKRGTTVHLFLSNHGRIETVKLGGEQDVSVKRPVYNLTAKPKRRLRVKESKPVAQAEAPAPIAPPVEVEAAILRAEVRSGCH